METNDRVCPVAIVNAVHLLIYTSNPEADRGFFRDVLGFKSVDVGHGWLIFGLPPAEFMRGGHLNGRYWQLEVPIQSKCRTNVGSPASEELRTR